MIGRREFLKTFGAGAVLAASSRVLAADTAATEPCVIDLMRAGERYLIDIRSAEGLRIAAHLLRDIEAGGIVGIPDYNTLRLMAWTQAWMANYGRYTVLEAVSGLRTREHNAHVENAASNSRHIPDAYSRFSGVDIKPHGIDKEYFGQLVARTRFGGVGWYKTHIHLDCRAKPEYWRVGV